MQKPFWFVLLIYELAESELLILSRLECSEPAGADGRIDAAFIDF